MRLYEIETRPSDQMICEGILDSIKKSIGSRIDSQIRTVTNTATALVVIYRAASDPSFLETITFLLKKNIKQKLKEMGRTPMFQPMILLVNRVFPKGRGITDFLKSLFLVSVLNVIGNIISKGKEWVVDNIKDSITDFVKNAAAKLVTLDSVVGSMTNANAIFQFLGALGVANEILFEVLDYLNRKIINAPVPLAATAQADI